MLNPQNISLFILRVSLGGLFFYAGITKVLDSSWSAAGYIGSAQTFPHFFAWFLQPNILPLINLVNEWGLTLIGVSLILGIFVRFSAVFGIALMVLYYLVVLNFPYVGEHGYLVDEHVIYIGAFLVLMTFHAGRVWGLGNKIG